MTRLDLGTIERIALETAESPSPLLEALRERIGRDGPMDRVAIATVHNELYGSRGREEWPFFNALFSCFDSPPPDRRQRTRRSADFEADRKSVELIRELGHAFGRSIDEIFGTAVGDAFDDSVANLNRKIAAHEPRAGEGRTDDD